MKYRVVIRDARAGLTQRDINPGEYIERYTWRVEKSDPVAEKWIASHSPGSSGTATSRDGALKQAQEWFERQKRLIRDREARKPVEAVELGDL